MKRRLLATCFILATASNDPPPVEPAEKPDWALVRRDTEARLTANLYDPGAAQIRWTNGFAWGSAKRLGIGGRKWGWIGCVEINAKNQFGGYVGPQVFVIRVDDRRAVSIFDTADYNSKCDRVEGATALQPELAPVAAGSSDTPVDQLTKLADLLKRGLVTQAEFDAEKARLLTSPRR